jgi:hypothetical protein
MKILDNYENHYSSFTLADLLALIIENILPCMKSGKIHSGIGEEPKLITISSLIKRNDFLI